MYPFESHQTTLNRTAVDDPIILSGQFWGELRVFLAVAKAKSFNKAAEILNTSHPTVSRQVKRLQDLVGSQLFVPTRSGVQLTAKGEELARSLIALDQSLFSLTNDLKAESREAEGLVRVAVTDGLNASFVAPNLRNFSLANPRVQVSLQPPHNVTDMRENVTDVMVGFAPVANADVTFTKLGTLHFIPIASRDYVRSYGLPTRTNLEKHHFIQSSYYAAKHWRSWQDLVDRGYIAHHCENPLAYAMLVKAGLGIGLLGSYTTLDPASIPLDLDVHIEVPFFVMALTERLNSKPVRLVYDWLCEVFSAQNPWFAPELNLGSLPSEYDIGFRLMFNF